MNKKKIIPFICIILIGGVVIGLLLWFGLSHKDSFCGACSNIGLQVNTNRPLLNKLYNSGELTENSKLEKGAKWKVGPYMGSQFTQYPVNNARACA